MKREFELIAIFPVVPEALYNAWLDSKMHSAMTGGEANCSDEEGAEFSAWDGYITGQNISLTPYEEIVQTWRTTEFKTDDEDSVLSLLFRGIDHGKTELTLIHQNIPEGQTSDYEKGWREHYFEPMTKYFKK